MIRRSKDEHLRWIYVYYYVGIIFILDINFLLTFTLFFNDILCPINLQNWPAKASVFILLSWSCQLPVPIIIVNSIPEKWSRWQNWLKIQTFSCWSSYLDSSLLCCVEDKSFDCKHCFSCQMAGQGLHILVQRMSLVCGSLHYHIRRMAHLQSPMALK